MKVGTLVEAKVKDHKSVVRPLPTKTVRGRVSRETEGRMDVVWVQTARGQEFLVERRDVRTVSP